MKLTLHDADETITQGVIGIGGVFVYRVGGLPAGENAQIAAFNDSWRVLRWNETWHGNWTGAYPAPEAALAALRDELLITIP